MAEEYGSSNYTNDKAYSNGGKQSENRSHRANPAPKEFHDYTSQQESTSTQGGKKTGKTLRRLFTAAAATVAAVTILPDVTHPALDIRFEYLSGSGRVLEYVVSFDSLPEENELSIVVSTPNGNTLSEQPVEDEIVSGSVEDLLPGYRYEIFVKDGDFTLASRVVTMENILTTELSGVEHECFCAVDGTFHFRLLGLKDENNYWSNYRATLTDEFGNSSSCDFSSDPSAEHTLAVNDAGMRGNRAHLKITCWSSEPDENGGREPRERVLYENDVNI